jgi:hypothetical protein
LRVKETAKIKCGRAHFAALAGDGEGPRFVVATGLDEVLEDAMSSRAEAGT